MNKNQTLWKTFYLDGFLAIAGFAASVGFVSTVLKTSDSSIESAGESAGTGNAVTQLTALPLALHVDAMQKDATARGESYCVNPISSISLKRQALIRVSISPESRVKVSVDESAPTLVHQQWTECVIAIENAAGVRSHLQLQSEQFVKDGQDCAERWLRAELVSTERLSGESIEYRTVRFWSRDAGKRAAAIQFNVGQGTQDLGFRSDVLLVFDVQTP